LICKRIKIPEGIENGAGKETAAILASPQVEEMGCQAAKGDCSVAEEVEKFPACRVAEVFARKQVLAQFVA
jgi:hypothetical protein